MDQVTFTNTDTAQNLAAWFQAPHASVGTTVTNLSNAPKAIDGAARLFSKNQTYTSWDCFSRAYFARLRLLRSSPGDQGEMNDQPQPEEEIVPENPSDLTLRGLDAMEQKNWENGGLVYVHGMFMTKRKFFVYKKLPEWERHDIQMRTPGAIVQRDMDRTLDWNRNRRSTTGATSGTNSSLLSAEIEQQRLNLRLEELNTQIGYLSTNVQSNIDELKEAEHAYDLARVQMAEYEDASIYNNPETFFFKQSMTDGELRDIKKSGAVPAGATDLKPTPDQAKRAATRTLDERKRLSDLKMKRDLTEAQSNKVTNDSKKQITELSAEKERLKNAAVPAVGTLDPAVTKGTGTPPDNSKDKTKGSTPSKGKARDKLEVFTVQSDTIPVRVFSTSCYPTLAEQVTNPERSPLYSSLAARITDPNATGALGSILKSAAVRDAASLLTLVRSLNTNPASYLEVAPLLRSICMITSLNLHCYDSDLTEAQFVREITVNSTAIQIVPRVNRNFTSSIIAMPLDTFISFMSGKFYPMMPQPFTAIQVDQDWTAIPVRARQVNQHSIIPYIVSFLTSSFWNGTVNIYKNVSYSDTENDQHTVDGRCLSIPAINSTYIPGVKNAILVLVDETSIDAKPHILIQGQQIPIYRGQDNAVQPVNFYNMWTAWYIQDNWRTIQTGTMLAINEICLRLATSNTCSIVKSLAADIYAAARPGMYVPHTNKRPSDDYDITDVVFGGYTFIDSEVPQVRRFSKKSSLLVSGIPPSSVDDSTLWRERMVGYNFASYSALHLPPSGVVRIHVEADANNNNGSVQWETDVPLGMTTQYNITTCSSLTRLAIYVGLIHTHTDSLLFDTLDALPAWIHMLSAAHLANTSLFLTTNNMNLRDWAGYSTTFDDIHLVTIMRRIKDTLFTNMVRHIQVEDEVTSWNNWDADQIRQFYGIDPFDDENWGTHSPIPVHFAIQWAEKLKLYKETSVPSTVITRLGTDNIRVIPMKPDIGFGKLDISATIDFERSRPVTIRANNAGTRYHGMWVDNYSHLTLKQSRAHAATERSFVASSVPLHSPVNINLPYVDDDNLYVYGSVMESADASRNAIRTTSISWPDPPSWQDVLHVAKNYVVEPAAAALMGAVQGGIPGAVLGGGAALTGNAIKDIMAAKEHKQLADNVTKEVTQKLMMERAQEEAKTHPAPTAPTAEPTDISQPPQAEAEVPSPDVAM